MPPYKQGHFKTQHHDQHHSYNNGQIQFQNHGQSQSQYKGHKKNKGKFEFLSDVYDRIFIKISEMSRDTRNLVNSKSRSRSSPGPSPT